MHEKTGGNPFFALQFLSSLVEEALLIFDHDAVRWSWDLEHIHAKGYTDNVVDLMIGRLTRLPPETREAVQQLDEINKDLLEFNRLRTGMMRSGEKPCVSALSRAASAAILK